MAEEETQEEKDPPEEEDPQEEEENPQEELGHLHKPQQQIWTFNQLGPLQASSTGTELWQTTSLMS